MVVRDGGERDSVSSQEDVVTPLRHLNKEGKREPIRVVHQAQREHIFSPSQEMLDVTAIPTFLYPNSSNRHMNRTPSLNTERDLLVLSHKDNPMLTAAREKPPRMQSPLVGLLDFVTNLCGPAFACAAPSSQPPQKRMADNFKGDVSSKGVYPVQRFAGLAALDEVHLLKERQKYEQHNLFRPVSEDNSIRRLV